MEETKPVCPFCQSTLVVRLGNETHCNSCAKSWGLDKNAISTAAADRRRRASASTGYSAHESEGLATIEQEINQAEEQLRDAVLNVARCRETSEELLRLRQAERAAKDRLDKLLADRGELATHKSRPWPQR